MMHSFQYHRLSTAGMCETVLQMGCDIVSWAEIYVSEVEGWKAVENAFAADAFEREQDHLEFVSTPFRNRNYVSSGFLQVCGIMLGANHWPGLADCRRGVMPPGFAA